MPDEPQQPGRGVPKWKRDKEEAVRHALFVLSYHFNGPVLVAMYDVSEDGNEYIRWEPHGSQIQAASLLDRACNEGLTRAEFEAEPDEPEGED